MTMGLVYLPDDIVKLIMSKLAIGTHLSASARVCRQWRHVLNINPYIELKALQLQFRECSIAQLVDRLAYHRSGSIKDDTTAQRLILIIIKYCSDELSRDDLQTLLFTACYKGWYMRWYEIYCITIHKSQGDEYEISSSV
jgi:hypothetical protein